MDKRASYPLLIAAFLLLLSGAPAARAGVSISFAHAGPILAGGERFDGGEVSLEDALDGVLLALRIDGRSIALYFIEGPRPGAASALLARRGMSGHEIVGLRGADGRDVALRLATASTQRSPEPAAKLPTTPVEDPTNPGQP